MSVIIAKAGSCCSSAPGPSITTCLPAVSAQALVKVGLTINVDAVPTSSWCASKWYVVVSTVSNSRVQSYEIFSAHHNGLSADFNEYTILGDTILHTANVYINAGNLTLEVTNNDAEDLIVYATRIAIPIIPSIVSSLIGVNLTETQTSVLAGTTGVIDSFNYPSTRAVNWCIAATDANNNKQVFQVFATMQGGVVGDIVMYGMFGIMSMNFVVGVNVVGFTLQLTLTNNELVDIKVSATRILVETESPPTCETEGNVSIWLPAVTTVGAGLTVDIDAQVTIPGHDAVKWFVGVFEPTTGNQMAFELIATHQQLISPTFVQYSMIGDILDIDMSVSTVDLNMILTLTNNEASSVRVNIIRIPVSI